MVTKRRRPDVARLGWVRKDELQTDFISLYAHDNEFCRALTTFFLQLPQEITTFLANRPRLWEVEFDSIHMNRVMAIDECFERFRNGEAYLPTGARQLGGRVVVPTAMLVSASTDRS